MKKTGKKMTARRKRWKSSLIIVGFVVALLCMTGGKSSDENRLKVTQEKQMHIIEVQETEAIKPEGVITELQESNGIENNLEVHFIDVGQGDATLIKSGEHAMLIDAGDNSKGTTVQLYLKKQGIEKLDYLVLTHTDADHIGGADVIVTKYDIDTIFLGDFEKDNQTYRELMEAIEYRNMNYSVPEVGSEYQLGNASFTIIAPNFTYDNPNDTSIGLVLRNGENTFLFSGDAEAEAEADILSNGMDIDIDVYHAAHHGSSTSSTQAFLKAMTPIYSVISCEKNNSYGHPHRETLDSFQSMGIEVFRTDEQGSIVAYSDGKELTWSCTPSESWAAGTPIEQPQKSITGTLTETAGMESQGEDKFAVNTKNGKIHMVGECPATGNGENAMESPIYFSTYEEAEVYSIQVAPGEEKRKCGNCW